MRSDTESDTQLSQVIFRNGRLTITPRPFPMRARPAGAYADALRNAGSVMAELALEDSETGRELTVRFAPPESQTEEAVDALMEWALLAGCSRVWLPDRVVDLDGRLIPPPDELESAECPTCGIVAAEHTTVDDLARSRQRGLRSRTCPVCMTRLPERRSTAAVGQARSSE